MKALIAGEKQLSSKQTLQAYRIGTSGNVVRIKQALMEREVIDVRGNEITFQRSSVRGVVETGLV